MTGLADQARPADRTRSADQARPAALFAGLCTLDVIQLVDHAPDANEKLVASRQTVAAGGPATNAAATFAHLGGSSVLLTGVGGHPLASGIRADLEALAVRLVDVVPDRTASPSVSSILVSAASGDRAVVSTNAAADRLVPPADLDDLVRLADVVQIDGHHPALAAAALSAARRWGRLTVLDAGSWKPGTAELLGSLDVVACSADFHPPGVSGVQETAAYLLDSGALWAVVTRGAEPVRWWDRCGGSGEIPVPTVRVVDTLGAGDVFHGALTFGLAALALSSSVAVSNAEASSSALLRDSRQLPRLLRRAVAVAATACASFGTRDWMGNQPE